MLKNLFKAAKKALKNPIVQLGIGALVPGMLPASMGILRNPAIFQAGIGALAGDKPADIARNIGIQALLGGFRAPEGKFMEGVKETFRTPTVSDDTVKRIVQQTGDPSYAADAGDLVVDSAKQYAKGDPTTFLSRLGESVTDKDFLINAAQLAVPFIAASQMKDDQIQVDPQAISGLDLAGYRAALEESPYQSMAAAGGIQGFARGGADPTNGMNQVSYGSTMGEPNGLFTGPGGPKEDNILARLSSGEYVIQASSVNKFGRGFFDKLNAGQMPKSNVSIPGGMAESMFPGMFIGGFVSDVFKGGKQLIKGAGKAFDAFLSDPIGSVKTLVTNFDDVLFGAGAYDIAVGVATGNPKRIIKGIKNAVGMIKDSIENMINGIISGDPMTIALLASSFILPGVGATISSALGPTLGGSLGGFMTGVTTGIADHLDIVSCAGQVQLELGPIVNTPNQGTVSIL